MKSMFCTPLLHQEIYCPPPLKKFRRTDGRIITLPPSQAGRPDQQTKKSQHKVT